MHNIYNKVLTLPLVAACTFQSSSLWAASDQQLAPIEVRETSDQLPASQTPPSARTALPVSVQAEQTFTRQDIEELRPRDIFDLMETALGMNITRQGSRVNNFSSNRGGSVSFLIDGVYLTGNQATRVIGDIPVGSVDSIQFVRDGSVLSVLPIMGFGSRVSSPTQGVVVINTIRKPGDPDKAQLKLSYGTYDTWKASGAFKESWFDGHLQLNGGYQHSQSDGKDDWNNAYSSDAITLSGGWKDSEFMAMASLFVNQGEREIQRYIGVLPNSSVAVGELNSALWKYDPRDMQVYTINLARYWDENHTTSLTYGTSKADGTAWYYDTKTDPATVPGRYFKDESTDLHLSHTIVGEQNTFKVGAQRIAYTAVTEYLDTAEPAPREEEIYGLYLTDEYLVTPAWSIDTSLRMDKKHITKGGDKYAADGSVVKLSNDSWTDKAYLLSLGTAWQINPVWRISGRYGYSQTPTPDTITTLNNQDLPDERLDRWELGLNAKLHPAFNASFTPFYYVVKDAKVVASGANSSIQVFNSDTGSYEAMSVYTTADEVIRKGFELSLNGRFADEMWGYELGWSHFKDDSIDADSGQVETPENRYTARLDWRYGAWNSTLSALKVDEYCHYFRGACLPTGDFTTVNLNVSRKLDHGVTVSFYGQNLTDENYYTRHKTGNGQTTYNLSDGAITDVGATYGIEIGVEF